MNLTLLIIVATVAASYYAWQNLSVFENWTFKPFRVKRNQEYLRFITSSLIHSDGMHLFFNMLSFWFFGPVVEKYMSYYSGGSGAMYLLGLYVGGMIVSEIPTYFRYQNDSSYGSIGASGAVSAVIFASILFQPTSTILVMFIPMPAFAYGAIYLLYSAYASKNDYTGRINHDAHLYGSLFGIVLSAVLFPEAIREFFVALASWRIF